MFAFDREISPTTGGHPAPSQCIHWGSIIVRYRHRREHPLFVASHFGITRVTRKIQSMICITTTSSAWFSCVHPDSDSKITQTQISKAQRLYLHFHCYVAFWFPSKWFGVTVLQNLVYFCLSVTSCSFHKHWSYPILPPRTNCYN